MTTVKVVHMRTRGKISKTLSAGAMYFYCGRPSRLGNPFNMKHESQRQQVVEAFRSDKNCIAVTKEFAEYVKDLGLHYVELGCFCYPKPCHCDVIKEEVENTCNKID